LCVKKFVTIPVGVAFQGTPGHPPGLLCVALIGNVVPLKYA
jgi:hypothetical protein